MPRGVTATPRETRARRQLEPTRGCRESSCCRERVTELRTCGGSYVLTKTSDREHQIFDRKYYRSVHGLRPLSPAALDRQVS